VETILEGKPRTPFLQFGDRVGIEMLDEPGRSIFGAIEQEVVPTPGAEAATSTPLGAPSARDR
jgi:hypothetical protein